jgi:hypothetical protein
MRAFLIKVFQFMGMVLATSGMMFFAALGATLIAHGIFNLNFLLAVLGVASFYIFNCCVHLVVYFVRKMEGI